VGRSHPCPTQTSSLMPSFVFNTSDGEWMRRGRNLWNPQALTSVQDIPCHNQGAQTLTRRSACFLRGQTFTTPSMNSPTGPVASKCNQPYRSLLSRVAQVSFCCSPHSENNNTTHFPVVFALCRSNGPSLEPSHFAPSVRAQPMRRVLLRHTNTNTNRHERH
jgi:hypothetical protein